MGKYEQGILGPFRGRIANIIGTYWKGRYIMRIRAANVTNPNTIPQQVQRMKWTLVSSFLTANQKLIKLGFAAVDRAFTPYNNGMKYMLEHAIDGAFPALSLNPALVKLALGKLVGFNQATAESTEAATIKIDWQNNADNLDASLEDQVMVAVIDDATGEVINDLGSTKRGAETASIVLPATWSGRSVHVHAFLVASGLQNVSDMNQVSESQYLGVLVVA